MVVYNMPGDKKKECIICETCKYEDAFTCIDCQYTFCWYCLRVRKNFEKFLNKYFDQCSYSFCGSISANNVPAFLNDLRHNYEYRCNICEKNRNWKMRLKKSERQNKKFKIILMSILGDIHDKYILKNIFKFLD